MMLTQPPLWTKVVFGPKWRHFVTKVVAGSHGRRFGVQSGGCACQPPLSGRPEWQEPDKRTCLGPSFGRRGWQDWHAAGDWKYTSPPIDKSLLMKAVTGHTSRKSNLRQELKSQLQEPICNICQCGNANGPDSRRHWHCANNPNCTARAPTATFFRFSLAAPRPLSSAARLRRTTADLRNFKLKTSTRACGTCLVVNFALWTRVFRSTVHMTWICITRRRLAKLYIREVDWWDRTIYMY